MKRIENMTNEEFKSVDYKELQKLSPGEQYHILFECKNDRISNITNDQFQGIHQETISIFLHSVDNDNAMEDKLIKFIPTINFKYLSIDNIVQIFEKKDEIISREQIHQIDLFEVKKMNQKLYQKIIIKKYFNFSFDQLYFLTQNGNLNDIKESSLPENFLSIINIIKNTKTFARFNIYCSNPDKYALQKDILTDMPPLLKIIYMVNYAKKVNDELKNDFQPSIEFLFSNPSLFCSDIFLFLINEWPKKIISKCITNIDINNFPKMHLFTLFKKFELSHAAMNQFQINEIYKIKNKTHHNYIFKTLLNFYIDTKNNAKVQQINIKILGKDEIEFLISKCCDQLKNEQIQNIDLNILSDDIVLHLLNFHAKNISDAQLPQLYFGDPSVAKIMILSNNINNIKKSQIEKVQINKIGDDAAQKFINFLLQKDLHVFMKSDQVKQINVNLINDPLLQSKFIIYFTSIMSNDQISNIDFAKFDSKTIFSIIKSFELSEKLHLLNQEQIKHIDIFSFDDYYLNIFFITPVFVQYLTNNQVNMINTKTIKSIRSINLSNVLKSFLNFVVKNLNNVLDERQIRQINLDLLNEDLYLSFINDFYKIFSEDQIQSIDFNKIPKPLMNDILDKHYEKICPKQVKKLQIKELYINVQIKILRNKINDLNDEQINCFDTKDTTIAEILIDKKYEILSQQQFDCIELSSLNIKTQAKILNRNSKQFNKLDKNLIKKINLNAIKSYNYDIYYDLIMIKTELFTNNQLMEIDWLDDSHDENHEREFFIPSRLFLERFKNINDDISNLFLKKNAEVLTISLKNVPVEILVAILNPRIINKLLIEIPSNIDQFLPAIKSMFISSDRFLTSVEYIINSWTPKFHNILSKYIQYLNPANYSDKTISTLLSRYICEINAYVLQSFNISSISNYVIEHALLFRATDFKSSQFAHSNFPNSLLISKTVNEIKTNIQNVNLRNIPNILVNFLVNRIPGKLKTEQFQQINLYILHKNLFEIMIDSQLDKLSCEQINGLKFNSLTQNQINNVVIKRSKDFLPKTIEEIKLNNLSIEALEQLIINKVVILNPANIQNQLSINSLNQLKKDVRISFLKVHVSNLNDAQIREILITDPEIAALLIEKKIKCLKTEQIHQIFNLNISDINSLLPQKAPKKTFLKHLRISKRFKDIPKEKFNKIINFKSNRQITEILSEDLQDQISQSSAKDINIANLIKNASSNKIIKLVKSCAEMFKDEQIQSFSLKNSEIAKILIDKQLESKFSKGQVQEIDLNQINEVQLTRLFISKMNSFTKDQLNMNCVTQILPKIPNNIMICLLETREGDLAKEQIPAINVDDDIIAAILLINRAEDISRDQIQKINFFNDSNVQKETKKRKPEYTTLYYIQRIHRYYDFSEEQLNKCIKYDCMINIIEILNENLENKISDENFKKIPINQLYQKIDKNKFSSFFNAYYSKFSEDQIMQLDTNEPEIAKLIISNNLFSKLSKDQQIKFNKNELFQCTDLQLTSILNKPWNNSNDYLVSGLLLYRYFSIDVKNDALNNFYDDLINQNQFDDIFYAKLILIAQESFKSKGVLFAKVKKNFFDTFKQRNSLQKLEKKEAIQVEYKEFSITPNDLMFIFWQEFKIMDMAHVSNLLDSKNNLFGNLGQEYKSKLNCFKIKEEIDDEGDFQKILIVDKSKSNIFTLFG